MLKYQRINIAFALSLIITAIIDIYVHVSLLLYAGIIIAFAGLLVWGSANIRSGMYCKSLCSGNMKKKSLALTFDDGPDKTITPALLDLLSKEDVRAAFFCIGEKAGKNSELIKQIDNEGHIIGGHSYSHNFFFDLFNEKRMSEELEKSEDVIKKIINRKIKLFRPPYGVTNPPLARALGKMNYHVIGWSLKSFDTSIRDENKLFERVVNRFGSGDIILFHDTMSHSVNVVGRFIRFAKEKGFTFERLDKLLGIEAYE